MRQYDVTFTLKNSDDMELIDRVRCDTDYDGPNIMIYNDTQGRFFDVDYADVPTLAAWLLGYHALELAELTLVHDGAPADCDCTPCQEGGGLDLLFNYQVKV